MIEDILNQIKVVEDQLVANEAAIKEQKKEVAAIEGGIASLAPEEIDTLYEGLASRKGIAKAKLTSLHYKHQAIKAKSQNLSDQLEAAYGISRQEKIDARREEMLDLAAMANKHTLALYDIICQLNGLNKASRKDFYYKGSSKTFYSYDYITTKHENMDILYYDGDKDQFMVNSVRNHDKTIAKFPHYEY